MGGRLDGGHVRPFSSPLNTPTSYVRRASLPSDALLAHPSTLNMKSLTLRR